MLAWFLHCSAAPHSGDHGKNLPLVVHSLVHLFPVPDSAPLALHVCDAKQAVGAPFGPATWPPKGHGRISDRDEASTFFTPQTMGKYNPEVLCEISHCCLSKKSVYKCSAGGLNPATHMGTSRALVTHMLKQRQRDGGSWGSTGRVPRPGSWEEQEVWWHKWACPSTRTLRAIQTEQLHIKCA